MTATAGLTIPHSVNPIFQYIFDAHFHIGGYVNKQNCRIWGSENSNVIIEKPMYPQQVTVWYGFWYGGIIGPFFFENEHGAAVTVNGECYRAMLNGFLFPKIKEDDMDDICDAI